MDNNFLSPKSMEWVEEKDQNLVFFTLILKKLSIQLYAIFCLELYKN
jgi:hypothetical protein